MKKIILLVLSIPIFIASFDLTAFPQKSKKNGKTEKTVKTAAIKKSKIISLGVVNSRAINLVQPKYPAAANYLGIHGTVQVSIIVDENGDVIEAKALNGNWALISNSLIAAKESKFEPFKLNDGNAIKIKGLILYNFHPQKLNWFELGFYSNNPEKLREYLPVDFVAERQLIEQFENAESDTKKRIYETIISSIGNKLSFDEKNFRLFKTGIFIRNFNRKFQTISEIEKFENELQNPIFTSPQNLFSQLKARLEMILKYSRQNNDTKFDLVKQNLIDNSFMFGNQR